MPTARRAPTLSLLLAAAALAAAAAAPVGPARAEYASPHGVAVIIGNRTYRNERVPEVAYAHRDAEAFRHYVVDVLGFDPGNIIELRDATQAEMEDALGNERSHQGKLWRYLHPRHGSDVVVFYSGHGVPGLKDGRGYLLPVDANPDSAEINGYPIDVLYENLGKLAAAKTARVFLDACFSGDSDRGMLVRSASPVFVPAALPEASAEKLTVLAAASGKEVASWDDEAGHGLFTRHVLDALYGEGDLDGDGRVTAVEAKTYLDDTMTIAARRRFGRHQNASLNGEVGVVLARAGEGGVFPPRPALGEAEPGPGATGKAAEPETVGSAGAEPPPPAESPESEEAALDLTHAQRVLVQEGLTSLGADVGRADGIFGARTRAGVRSIQKEKGLPETGHLTAELSAALQALGEEARGERRTAEEARRAEAERKREAERQRAAAARRADDEAFAEARRRNTPASYGAYLARGGRHEAEARALLAEVSKPKWDLGKKFRDCPDCPEMMVVSGGSYEMGSPPDEEGRNDDEGPVHRVTIGESFAVGVYEVTRGEWGRFVSATGYSSGNSCWTYQGGEWKERTGRSWRSPGFAQGDGHPVVCVSWRDAQSYVDWLSQETGERYRLLSESEWEYAARGGTVTSRYWGRTEVGQCRHANGGDRALKNRYSDWEWSVAACDDGHVHTSPAGSFRPNRYGLYDVLGNAWEWVEDCWHESYRGAPSDGRAWTTGNCVRRVLRGGSWYSKPRYLRSALRSRLETGNRHNYIGFRIARTLD